MSVRDLFGGAMRIEVPSEWIDTEAFMDIIKRPVPDNQEIFMSPQNTADDSPDAARSIALFVDVLELATDVVDLEQLPYFHVIEILKRDERADEIEGLVVAPGSPLELHLSSTLLPEDSEEVCAIAATFEECDVEVVVVRLQKCNTDLIFSLHGRIAASPEVANERCPSLTEIVASLDIIDWGLFGGAANEEEGTEEQGDRLLGS